ncbi:hypothetical protein G7Y79_00028g061730 [Physcia stellaris]|nr:hypothetical protein G7Y79_00028g061730 [Physcia stellaris]
MPPDEAKTTSHDQRLQQLLQQCPDIASATNELQRLSEYASDSKAHGDSETTPDARLTEYTHRRSQGEPLEYILGRTQWGGLDILCRSGTLIPRSSSEIVASKLARALTQLKNDAVAEPTIPLRIADVGTGTGCASLFLHSVLHPPRSPGHEMQPLEILGGDVSSDCLKLASDNLDHNVRLNLVDASSRTEISFQHLDMLELGEAVHQSDERSSPSAINGSSGKSFEAAGFLRHKWDALISYPPCVPSADFLPGGRVPYTDRAYQPKLAIVPPELADNRMQKLEVDPADVFFYILLQVALKAGIKATVLEVCEGPQATRVRKMAARIMPPDAWIERWRDDTVFSGDGLVESDSVDQNEDAVHGRAVVVWQGDWADWRRRER